MFLGLNIIASFFSSYGDIEDIPSDVKLQYTNIIKMTVYLFVEFIQSFNTKIETDYKLILLETKVFYFYTLYFLIYKTINYRIM